MSGTKRLPGAIGEEDGRELPNIDHGSTVLLLASTAHPHGREACRDLLTVSPTDQLNVLYVTLTRPGNHQFDWWTSETAPSPERVVVIDAAPGPSPTGGMASEGVVCDTAGSPRNLTKIGVAVSERCKEFEGDGTTVVCLRSLTALLQYVELETAYRFLNAVVNQLATVGAIGHCHINPDAHTRREITALQTLFDASIRIDATDGTVQR